jgi:hypothetical protein
VAVCLAGNDDSDASSGGVLVHGELAGVMLAVRQSEAVLACPS